MRRHSRWDQGSHRNKESRKFWGESSSSTRWPVQEGQQSVSARHSDASVPLDFSSSNRHNNEHNEGTSSCVNNEALQIANEQNALNNLFSGPWQIPPPQVNLFTDSEQSLHGSFPSRSWHEHYFGKFANYVESASYDANIWQEQKNLIDSYSRVNAHRPRNNNFRMGNNGLPLSCSDNLIFNRSRKECDEQATSGSSSSGSSSYSGPRNYSKVRSESKYKICNQYNKLHHVNLDLTHYRRQTTNSDTDKRSSFYIRRGKRENWFNDENRRKRKFLKDFERSDDLNYKNKMHYSSRPTSACAVLVSSSHGQSRREKNKSLESQAESTKKTALAVAANKLKKSFLTSKEVQNKSHADVVSKEKNVDNVEDLSLMKEGKLSNCLEYDIDIRFTSSEWAGVGRGEGGTRNVFQVSDSVDDNFDYPVDLCIDISEENSSNILARKRHMSESCSVIDLSPNKIKTNSSAGRIRSSSLSVVEGSLSEMNNYDQPVSKINRESGSSAPKLKKILLKQLLSMDKTLLQELVSDPISRKSRYMMAHLMSEHRSALTKRIDQLRFKSSENINDAELHMCSEEIESNMLSSDILQQVRYILDLEEKGDIDFEEIMLSLREASSESDTEQDCRILSPPVEFLNSTVTINDSESEDSQNELSRISNHKLPSTDVPLENQNSHLISYVEHQENADTLKEKDLCSKNSGEMSPRKLENCDISTHSLISMATDNCEENSSIANQNSNDDKKEEACTSQKTIAIGIIEKTDLLEQETAACPDSTGEASVSENKPFPLISVRRLSPQVQVKEERPSPVIECGLCFHSSSRASACGCHFGLAPQSPLALHPDSLPSHPPQTLPHIADQRPALNVPVSVYSEALKREQNGASYMKLDHVTRPTSEERPRNPAPCDDATSSSPLQLSSSSRNLQSQPLPPPQSIVFSPERGFSNPPRPPPPPPPHHSPHIKVECQTPLHFMCCCMRNECDRSNSHHSAEMRYESKKTFPGFTSDSGKRTPHIYKMEPPSPCSHSRTPHPNGSNLFAMPLSPRNGSGRCTPFAKNLNGEAALVKKQLLSSLNLQKNYAKADKGTNTVDEDECSPPAQSSSPNDDLATEQLCNRLQQIQFISSSVHKNKASRKTNSRRHKNLLQEVEAVASELNNIQFHNDTRKVMLQLELLSNNEGTLLRHLNFLEEEINELFNLKHIIVDKLAQAHKLQSDGLKYLFNFSDGKTGHCNSFSKNISISDSEDDASLPSNVNCSTSFDTSSSPLRVTEIKKQTFLSSPDHTFVSSSQDTSKGSCSTNDISNDSGSENQPDQTERCTSTSKSPDHARHDSINYCVSEDISLESCIEPEKIKDNKNIFELNVSEGVLVHDAEINRETFCDFNRADEENIDNDVYESKDGITESDGLCISATGSEGLSSLPSPKVRNSSGSEHGYSLRSKGPLNGVPDAEDSFCKGNEFEDILEAQSSIILKEEKEDATEEKRRRKKRKSKTYLCNKRKKKKCDKEIKPGKAVLHTCSKEVHADISQNCPEFERSGLLSIVEPPPHNGAVLFLKVVNHYLFSSSSDGSARCFDLVSGKILASYMHSDSVTSIAISGIPGCYDGSQFQVVTGSTSKTVCIFNGLTGQLIRQKNMGQSVQCLDLAWGYLFVGTEGGCGIRWNMKDKRLGMVVTFSQKAIMCLKAHIEGGRKVLVVAAKTAPIMVRDAMSGLFLRSFDHIQVSVYSMIFSGGVLYTGGVGRSVIAYDFCSGNRKIEMDSQADVLQVSILKDYIIVTCYDGFIRIFDINTHEMVHKVQIKSFSKMVLCSDVYSNKLLVGSKGGNVIVCDIPD